MEFTAVIEARASVRQFLPDPVPVAALKEMVRLAGLAPSANNSQPWKYIAVTNRDLLERMVDAVRHKLEAILPQTNDPDAKRARSQVLWFSTFFGEAPAVFVVLRRPYDAIIDKILPGSGISHEQINALRGHPDIQSIGASIEHLLLAAVALGYGGCWLSGPLVARPELEQLLGVCHPWNLAALAAIGKPAGVVERQERKPLEEIFELRT
jgi:nitroreductase